MYDVYLSMRHTPLSMYYWGWLEKYLRSHGVKIHHGFDRIRNGEFSVDLIEKIQISRNFIVILTPETFGQSDDNTSWMAYEIEAAIQNNANIIPIMSSDFIWPETLPPRVDSIRNKEGIRIEKNEYCSAPPRNLKDSIEAIKVRLLQAKRKENVFISYNTKDSDIANQIRDMLEKHDISCWIAPESIPAGKNYASVIPDAIENCDVFLLILSQNSQKSVWVPKELDKAINCQRHIIPFQTDNIPITNTFGFYLADCQIIHAYKNPEEAYIYLRESIYDILSNKTL